MHAADVELGRIHGQMSPCGFLRIHRGAVVNVERVAQLHPEGSGRYRLVMRDGTELVVSRSYSRRFRDATL